ncbi:UNVERIFIED_CONTAM: hypothetical protein K2H54_049922 [Gekko kuhli]
MAEGLQVTSEKIDLPNAHGTAEYIRIMVKWFDIMNVKSKYKGLHKLNPYMERMVSGDIKINFLLQFLDWLDRGGLKYPRQGVINVVSYTYVVVSKLLTTFEAAFLKPQTNQRAIACLKSLEALDESECILFDGVCDNGHSGIVYTRMITFIAVNTFLSNYCKKENGQRMSQTSQRKPKTLEK